VSSDCEGSGDVRRERAGLDWLAGTDQLARGVDLAENVPEQDATWTAVAVAVVIDVLPHTEFASVGERVKPRVELANRLVTQIEEI
jgi:hypothetical protein